MEFSGPLLKKEKKIEDENKVVVSLRLQEMEFRGFRGC